MDGDRAAFGMWVQFRRDLGQAASVLVSDPLLPALTAVLTGGAVALDSPPEVTSLREAFVMLIGSFCGATLIVLVVVECTRVLRRAWQRIGVRIAGSWIAASAACSTSNAPGVSSVAGPPSAGTE